MRNILSMLFIRSSKRQDIAIKILKIVREKGEITRYDTQPLINDLAKEFSCSSIEVRTVFVKLMESNLLMYKNSKYQLSDNALFKDEWYDFLRTGEVKSK